LTSGAFCMQQRDPPSRKANDPTVTTAQPGCVATHGLFFQVFIHISL
jgi:hypothetical protein